MTVLALRIADGIDNRSPPGPLQRWWRRARAAEREQASSQAASAQQSVDVVSVASEVKYFPIRRPAASIRRFLRESTSQEISVARKMASLSAFAYFMSSVTVRPAERVVLGSEVSRKQTVTQDQLSLCRPPGLLFSPISVLACRTCAKEGFLSRPGPPRAPARHVAM